jgi:hypothetical protein
MSISISSNVWVVGDIIVTVEVEEEAEEVLQVATCFLWMTSSSEFSLTAVEESTRVVAVEESTQANSNPEVSSGLVVNTVVVAPPLSLEILSDPDPDPDTKPGAAVGRKFTATPSSDPCLGDGWPAGEDSDADIDADDTDAADVRARLASAAADGGGAASFFSVPANDDTLGFPTEKGDADGSCVGGVTSVVAVVVLCILRRVAAAAFIVFPSPTYPTIEVE